MDLSNGRNGLQRQVMSLNKVPFNNPFLLKCVLKKLKESFLTWFLTTRVSVGIFTEVVLNTFKFCYMTLINFKLCFSIS